MDAATTDPQNLDDPKAAEQAARLTSSTVDYLANRDKLDLGDGEDFTPEDVSPEGTEHLAHMIGTYLPAARHRPGRGDPHYRRPAPSRPPSPPPS